MESRVLALRCNHDAEGTNGLLNPMSLRAPFYPNSIKGTSFVCTVEVEKGFQCLGRALKASDPGHFIFVDLNLFANVDIQSDLAQPSECSACRRLPNLLRWNGIGETCTLGLGELGLLASNGGGIPNHGVG
jgi:hypothetical protein